MAEAMAGVGALDLEALLLESNTRADQTQQAVEARAAALEALAMEQAALVAEAQAAISGTQATNTLLGEAKQDVITAKGAIAEATFPGAMEIEQTLYDISTAQNDSLAEIGDMYQSTVSELLTNLNVVKESESLGVIDGLKDPVKFVTAKYQAGKAKRASEVQMEQLVTLDAAQQQMAANYANRVSALNTKADARQQQHSALYFREIQASQVVARLNTQKEVDDASLTAMSQSLGLTAESAQNLRSLLSAELQLGDVSRQKITSAIQLVQLDQAKRAFDAAAAEGEKDAAIKESLEARWPDIKAALGLEYGSYTEFTVALRDGMVAPETAVVAGNLLTNGVLGSAAAMESTDPAALIDAAIANPNQSWLTPEFVGIYKKVKMENSAVSRPAEENAMLTNEALRTMHRESRTNIDALLVPARDILSLVPPSALASADVFATGLDGVMPVAALPMLQKLNVPVTRNTTFSQLSMDVIDRVARDTTMDLELMAQAMAGYGTVTLKNLNQATGFGLVRLGAPSLGENGDGTNAAHWYRAFQLRRVALQRSERVATQAGGPLNRVSTP